MDIDKFDFESQIRSSRPLEHYELRSPSISEDSSHQLGSLIISKPYGRFGNNFIQMTNAIIAAMEWGVPQVLVAGVRGMPLKDVVEYEGIKIRKYLPGENLSTWSLAGRFYYVDEMPLVSEKLRDTDRIADIHKRCLSVFFSRAFGETGIDGLEDAIVLHIRSGDLFTSATPHPGYFQPPSSFYIKSVQDALDKNYVRRVLIVSEDELNPAKAAIERWCESNGVRCEAVGKRLPDALRILFEARYVVTSKGSFYYPLFLMSPYVRRIYVSWLEGRYAELSPSVECDVVSVVDTEGGYGKLGPWSNSEAQRTAIATYPIESLAFR